MALWMQLISLFFAYALLINDQPCCHCHFNQLYFTKEMGFINLHAGTRSVRDDGYVRLHVLCADHSLWPEGLHALVVPVVGVAAKVDQAEGPCNFPITFQSLTLMYFEKFADDLDNCWGSNLMGISW